MRNKLQLVDNKTRHGVRFSWGDWKEMVMSAHTAMVVAFEVGMLLPPIVFVVAMLSAAGADVTLFALLSVLAGAVTAVLKNISHKTPGADHDNWLNGPGGSDYTGSDDDGLGGSRYTGSDDVQEAIAKGPIEIVRREPEEARPWRRAS